MAQNYSPALRERRKAYGRAMYAVQNPARNPWKNMLQRCGNPNAPNYSRYGGAGVRVHEPWRVFKQFLADVGERPSPRHSLDRWPDKKGNYEPGNVRWATPEEQGRNKQENHLVAIAGRVVTVTELSEITGIHRATINGRIRDGKNPLLPRRQPKTAPNS